MPQLFTVPALGLPALHNHRHYLCLILDSMGNGSKSPSVQTHGEDVITVRCPGARLGLDDIFYLAVFA